MCICDLWLFIKLQHITLMCSLLYFQLGDITKHLMTGPSGNSVFCFPETLDVPSALPRGKSRVSGKQNSLFPVGPVIKCLLSLFIRLLMSIFLQSSLLYNICFSFLRQQRFFFIITLPVVSLDAILKLIWIIEEI